MAACHWGDGEALLSTSPSMVCLARQFCVIDIQAEIYCTHDGGLDQGELGGEAWYKNIISHEYASMPLQRWFNKAFQLRNVGLSCPCYWTSCLYCCAHWYGSEKICDPPITLYKNPHIRWRDGLFITHLCTCISKLRRDASILLAALQRNDHT